MAAQHPGRRTEPPRSRGSYLTPGRADLIEERLARLEGGFTQLRDDLHADLDRRDRQIADWMRATIAGVVRGFDLLRPGREETDRGDE